MDDPLPNKHDNTRPVHYLSIPKPNPVDAAEEHCLMTMMGEQLREDKGSKRE